MTLHGNLRRFRGRAFGNSRTLHVGYGRKIEGDMKRRRRFKAALVGLLGAVVFAACGGSSREGSSTGGLPPDEAYQMLVDAVRGDPALKKGIPRNTFDAFARVACESLDNGDSPEALIELASQQPTQSGMPMRRESAEALVSNGVLANCPHHASKLP